MDSPNRRAFPRLDTRSGEYASFPGGTAPVRNLSAGGAMLSDPDPLPAGSPIRLELHLGAELVACTGVVRRAELERGMAVRFVELSPAARASLSHYLARTAVLQSQRRLSETPTGSTPRNDVPLRTRISAPDPGGNRLGELLVRRGLINADQLGAAAAQRQQLGGRLLDILVGLAVISEDDLVACLHDEYRIPIIDLARVEPTRDALRLVPQALASRHGILPIGVADSTLTIAIADPTNLDAINEVRFRSGCNLRVALAPARVLRDAIEFFYRQRLQAAG